MRRAQVTRARPVARVNGNGTTLWTPQKEDGSYWPPKRVFMMGSSTVYVRDVGMRRCSPKLGAGVDEETEVHCPYLRARGVLHIFVDGVRERALER